MRPLHPVFLVATCVAALAATPQPVPTVYLIGDSTMAERADSLPTLERGWGQMLARHLDPSVRVRDAAANGRSTKSFLAEGRWAAVAGALRPGDIVLVQFGHNDEKREDSTRYADPDTAYRRNLARFVGETRARGATPVLLTPIVRRKFDAAGALEDTHGAYPRVVRELARDSAVALVDLERETRALVAALGPEQSKAFYVWVPPGASPFYPQGRQDDTHLNAAGADSVAALAARELARSGTPLARLLRDR